MVPTFRNVGERCTAKNYCPISLLSMVSHVFEKLVNNKIVNHLKKCGFLLIFSTRPVAFDIFKAFDRVWHTGLLHKLKSYGISGQIFGLISSFLSNRWLWVVLDGKSSQEYPVNARVPQDSILSPTLFLQYIDDFPEDVICAIAIYADNTSLYILSVIRHLICDYN